MKKNIIDICYLIRKENNYKENYYNFFKHYKKTRPKIKHNIHVILKGFNKKDIFELKKIYNERIIFHILPNLYYDIGSYYLLAKKLKNDFCIFFNSNTIIRNKAWFNYFQKYINDKVGIIGTSASNETMTFRAPYYNTNNKFRFILKFFYRLFIKIHLSVYFNFFPNPHIRTNGFLIKRKSFIHYMKKQILPKKKFDCYLIESGKNSLTKYFENLGEEVLVIGNNGKSYKKDRFKLSDTFVPKKKNNCLIYDNQILDYFSKNKDIKKEIYHDVWGK